MPIILENQEVNHEPYFRILLSGGNIAKISVCDFSHISTITWYAKKSFSRTYAYCCFGGPGNRIYKSMHAEIMHPKRSQVVHHINRNTLDNRRSNLKLMSEYDHVKIHSWR